MAHLPEPDTDTKTGLLSDSVAADSLFPVTAASDSDDARAGCVSLLSVRAVAGSLPGVAEFEVAGISEAWGAGLGLCDGGGTLLFAVAFGSTFTAAELGVARLIAGITWAKRLLVLVR